MGNAYEYRETAAQQCRPYENGAGDVVGELVASDELGHRDVGSGGRGGDGGERDGEEGGRELHCEGDMLFKLE